jgi:hypothetical protein
MALRHGDDFFLYHCPACRCHVDALSHDEFACRAMREQREQKNHD